MWRAGKAVNMFCGFCPDPACRTKLYFPVYAATDVECIGCGQHHTKDSLEQVEQVSDPNLALQNLLRSVLIGSTTTKKGAELVKVKGLSNFHCILISHLLTNYGMDKQSGNAKLLKEMGQSDLFDCSLLGNRAFFIESEHIEINGYGKDETGSLEYLKETLQAIYQVNGGTECVLPVYTSGDGHCLVHALSRALVGRELFWHALRSNLKAHLLSKFTEYRNLFMDFIDASEWRDIIQECDPNFQPRDGEALGLRNIHIFILANVLHRPIILLDNFNVMQSSGDYCGVFLPALIPLEKCHDKDGVLNKPLTIAWSSMGHNHYIPLVGIKDKPVPKLPQWLLPKCWGVPQDMLVHYVSFDENDHCYLGGDHSLQDKYLQRLVQAMDEKFTELYGVSPDLVAEVHQYIFKPSGIVGMKPEMVTDATKAAVKSGKLFRCLSCNAVIEQDIDVALSLLQPGGDLYELAVKYHGKLIDRGLYKFPTHKGLVCVYDEQDDVLIPKSESTLDDPHCHLCQGVLRKVRQDGSVVYINGDRTMTPAVNSRCKCGYKHFWDGQEYDNLPESIPVTLEWGGRQVQDKVIWFQYESDPSRNSNVFEAASGLVQQHFPGEWGSERLVKFVVDQILRQTAPKEGENKGAKPDGVQLPPKDEEKPEKTPEEFDKYLSSKIILMGQKSKTLHKEELTLSESEKAVKARIEQNAALQQKRRAAEQAKKTMDRSPPKQPKQVVPAPQPELPKPASPRPVSAEKRIRLSTSDGRQEMISLQTAVTFSQLQQVIEDKFQIPQESQKLRYGFPPKELSQPEGEETNNPLPLQHGDKVMVEIIPVKATVDVAEERDSAEFAVDMSADSTLVDKYGVQEEGQSETESAAALASALMKTLQDYDLWQVAQNQPHLFEKGGLYYTQMSNDLGPLKHDQHCTLPWFPNKVFAYNENEDRLEVCLGQLHVPVQLLDNKQLEMAHSKAHPPVQAPHTRSEPSTSGIGKSAVLVNKEAKRQVAFTGQGRTLSSSTSVKEKPPDSHENQELPTLATNQGCDLLPTADQEAKMEEESPDTGQTSVEMEKLPPVSDKESELEQSDVAPVRGEPESTGVEHMEQGNIQVEKGNDDVEENNELKPNLENEGCDQTDVCPDPCKDEGETQDVQTKCSIVMESTAGDDQEEKGDDLIVQESKRFPGEKNICGGASLVKEVSVKDNIDQNIRDENDKVFDENTYMNEEVESPLVAMETGILSPAAMETESILPHVSMETQVQNVVKKTDQSDEDMDIRLESVSTQPSDSSNDVIVEAVAMETDSGVDIDVSMVTDQELNPQGGVCFKTVPNQDGPIVEGDTEISPVQSQGTDNCTGDNLQCKQEITENNAISLSAPEVALESICEGDGTGS